MADEAAAAEGAINFITADFADELRRLLDTPVNQGGIPNSPVLRPETPPPEDFGIPFINDSTEDIPAYACMRVVSLDTTTPRKVYSVTKPDATFGRFYLFNGPVICKYSGSKRGTAQSTPIIKASYDSGTPANGEGWGPKPSQWTLSKNYPEVALVQGVDATRGFLTAKWHQIEAVIGKPNADIASGTSGTVNVWHGTAGSEAVITSMQISSVYNRGGDVSTADFVIVEWIDGLPYIIPLISGTGGGQVLCKADAGVNKGSTGTFSVYTGTLGSETDSTVNITALCQFFKVASGSWCWAEQTSDGWYITATEPTALTVVTDVSWDVDTCVMTKDTGTVYHYPPS